jgi:hypothetical protein
MVLIGGGAYLTGKHVISVADGVANPTDESECGGETTVYGVVQTRGCNHQVSRYRLQSEDILKVDGGRLVAN